MPEAHELLSDTVVETDGGGRGVLEVDSGCRGRGQLELAWASWAPWAVTTGPQHWKAEDIQRWEDRPEGEERAGGGRRKGRMKNTRVRPTKPGAGMK